MVRAPKELQKWVAIAEPQAGVMICKYFQTKKEAQTWANGRAKVRLFKISYTYAGPING